MVNTVLASLGLILAAPVMLVFAIVVKLTSPGPIFYTQARVGLNRRRAFRSTSAYDRRTRDLGGRPFMILKFRTMQVGAEKNGAQWAVKRDARVTTVGRVMRKYRIDELPQLVNVLKGDMSLVGPRPHALSHNREYEQKIALYARRHNVLPGITGWAQVNGFRGETDTDEKMRRRVDHDLHYIDNWSLWFDLRILLLTVFSRGE